MIAILDYRAGNLTSVERALHFLNVPCRITDSYDLIRKAERIIFPGVGAAGKSMKDLKELGLDTLLVERLEAGVPVLGICVGLQVLFDYSEENDTRCMSLIPGRVRMFPANIHSKDGESLKIPHMGWNEVSFEPHPIFAGVPSGSEFYFVHSFYPEPSDPRHIVGRTDYGINFASAVAHRNLVAVQFHPEKSGSPGLQILRNFSEWNGACATTG